MTAIEPIYRPKPGGEPMSIAVFLSGEGSNLIALYEEQRRFERAGRRLAGIDAVFTNAPDCRGAARARELGIPVASLSSKSYFDILGISPDDDAARDYFDAASIAMVQSLCRPDLIVLAGYRRKVGRLFCRRYENRIVNLYPGDITKPYLVRGVDAGIQALRAGEDSIKCTVYLQGEAERFGRAIAQSPPVSLRGFLEQDAARIQEKIRAEGEWKVFAFAVFELIAAGRAGADTEGNIYIDGERVEGGGWQFNKSGV
ncbi:MAG: phosphoribosylglycinamide formyltransferase [Deltaproteobacteria bacterium]